MSEGPPGPIWRERACLATTAGRGSCVGGGPEEAREAEALNRRLVRRALDMDGTCTGEHGIGLGKQDWLVEELGEAVEMMRMIKRAIDPRDLFNPGKIFSL